MVGYKNSCHKGFESKQAVEDAHSEQVYKAAENYVSNQMCHEGICSVRRAVFLVIRLMKISIT